MRGVLSTLVAVELQLRSDSLFLLTCGQLLPLYRQRNRVQRQIHRLFCAGFHETEPIERLGDFVLRKGFYIFLFLCAAAIGISGYYLIRTVTVGSQPSQPAAASQAVTLPNPASPAPQTQEVVYTWPVKGEVLRGFSLETLAYDVTMGDWRTHGGVDLAAEAGLKVLAAGEGQVTQVYDDPMMGTTVVVEQPDGVTAVYSNLSNETAVAPGDSVETGGVLGTVGETAIAESGMPAHLHLEFYSGGAAVDPLDYLPQ